MKHKCILILAIGLCLSSCDLFDSSDTIPLFLELEETKVNTESSQGSGSSKIKEIWVIHEGSSLGIFPIPSAAPLLDDDAESSLIFRAGVRQDGFQSAIAPYPFYEDIEQTIVYEEGISITPDLTFQYKPETVFKLIEDFEYNHIFKYDADENPETQMRTSTDNPKEGLQSGVMRVDTSNIIIKTASEIAYEDIPQNGTPVWLEFDYRNEIPVQVGLLGFQGEVGLEGYHITLFPSEEWNKIYINLTPLIQLSGLDRYSLLFSSTLPLDLEEGHIWLDNIKLIHL